MIATQYSVGDGDAARVIETFYAADGARDPVRALATVQAAFSAASAGRHDAAPAWSAFEVIAGRPSRR